MKLSPKFLALVALASASVPVALAAPTLGGNIPALRPGYTSTDEQQVDLALSYLRPGDVARIPTIPWEIVWNPTWNYNYRGVDRAIQKLAMKGVTPIWLLTPCPAPSSQWYSSVWPDWWLPDRNLWPQIVQMNTAIVQHIIAQTKSYTRIQPLFQIWNEPEGGKPGGSITSKFGEWAPSLHELLYDLVTDLRSHQIPTSQIVGPAVSSFGEGGRSQAAEFQSMMPPKTFDWLSQCGYRDAHLRLSAPSANGDSNLVKAGFQNSLDWYKWIDSQYAWPVGQQTIVSEIYVTPGDCGVPIGVDMYPYQAAALDLMKASGFRYASVWGLRPGEADVPSNPWLVYGGFGASLVKWRSFGN